MSFNTNVLGAFIIGSLITYMATDNQDKCNESRPQVRPVQPVQRVQPIQQPVQTRADAAAEEQLAQRVQQPVQTRADAAKAKADAEAKAKAKADAEAKAKADAEAAARAKQEQAREAAAQAAREAAAQAAREAAEQTRKAQEQARKSALSASAPTQIIVKTTDEGDFTIPYTDHGVDIKGIDKITNRCLIISLAKSMKIPVDKFYYEITTKFKEFKDKIKEDDFKYPDSVDKEKIENQILGSEFIDVSNFLSLFKICLPAETGIILFSPADIETRIINLKNGTRNGYFKEPLNDKTIYIINLGDEHFVVGDNNGQNSEMHKIIQRLYTPIDTMQSDAPIQICDTINATDAREEEKEDEEVEKKNEDNEQAAAAKEQKRQEEAREQERLRAEAEAREQERLRAEAAAAEQKRLQAEAEAREQERLRAEAEAREQERLRAEAEAREQERLRAEAAAAEQKRLRAEAAAAEQERLRAEAEAREQERLRAEAVAAEEAAKHAAQKAKEDKEKLQQMTAEREAQEQAEATREAEKQERLRAEAAARVAEQKRKAEEQERLREEAAKELLEKAKSEVNAAADAEQQTEEKIRTEASNGETNTKDNVVNQIMKIINPDTTIPEGDYAYPKLIQIIASINHRTGDSYKIIDSRLYKLTDVDKLETILYKVLDNYINFKSNETTDNVTDNPSLPKFLTILQRLQKHNKLGGKTLRLRNRTKKTRKIKKNIKL